MHHFGDCAERAAGAVVAPSPPRVSALSREPASLLRPIPGSPLLPSAPPPPSIHHTPQPWTARGDATLPTGTGVRSGSEGAVSEILTAPQHPVPTALGPWRDFLMPTTHVLTYILPTTHVLTYRFHSVDVEVAGRAPVVPAVSAGAVQVGWPAATAAAPA